jgi:hypothetical protein
MRDRYQQLKPLPLFSHLSQLANDEISFRPQRVAGGLEVSHRRGFALTGGLRVTQDQVRLVRASS